MECAVDFQALSELQTLAFVVLGTLLGTVLRCGAGAVRGAAATLWNVATGDFDRDKTKAILAYYAERICKDGVIRAPERHCADPDIDDCIRILVRRRSVTAMEHAASEKHQAKQNMRQSTVQTLENAAELAPVFGLAGTLLALSQLPSGGVGAEGLMPTVAMAVQTTLFGLGLAHLVLMPLARWVDRRMRHELDERGKLLSWFVGQIEHAVPETSRANVVSSIAHVGVLGEIGEAPLSAYRPQQGERDGGWAA